MHKVTPLNREDESRNLSDETSTTKHNEKKSSRYQSPADFVSFCHNPCDSTLTDSLNNRNTELWLIKAPANFDPECFSGVTVPLSGLQTLRVPNASGRVGGGSTQQVYSVLSSTQGSSELCLLTSHSRSAKAVVLGPAFSGLINICESFGDTSTNQAPQVIPASPPPAIPPCLKQRFQPFGSKTPTLTCVAESEVDALGPSSATLLPRVVKQFPEEDEERKKRKKRKRDKTESEVELQEEEGVVKVKQEPDVVTPDLDESMEIFTHKAEVTEEKRKKKKKKDKERGEKKEIMVAHHSVKEENIVVKCEPMDSSYGDLQDLGKKKKKKNKSKHGDD